MMQWFKKSWGFQSSRIDAMSLRERAFLFVAVIAGSLVLADTLWLSPAQAAYQKLVRQFDKQSTELQRARADLKAVIKPAGTTEGVRDEIAAVKNRIDLLNQNIQRISPSATRQTSLAQVLAHVLLRHEGLTLQRISTLAPDAVVSSPSTSVGVAPTAGLARHGVELTVSGSYPDLTRYLETLEKVLPDMRWGTMRLKSEKLPPEVTLQLFLIEVKP